MIIPASCSYFQLISSAVLQVLSSSGSSCDVSFVSYDGYYGSVLENVLFEANGRFPLIIASRTLDKSRGATFWKSCSQVIVTDTIFEDDIQFTIQQHVKSVFWNHSANIVLVLTRPTHYQPVLFRKIFALFQRSDMLNVCLIYFDERLLKVQKFITTDYQSTVLKNATEDRSFGDIFPDKVRNLGKQIIRVTQFKDYPRTFIDEDGNISGIDGYIFDIICEKLNASFSLVGPYGDSNLQWKISFYDLVNKIADVSFNLRLILASFHIVFPVSILFGEEIDNIVLLVPTSKPIKSYKNLIEPFAPIIWLYVVLTFVAFSISWRLFTTLQTNTCTSFRDAFANSFRIHFLVPLTRTPKLTKERLFIVGFMIYSLVLMNGYQTILTSFLMSPRFEPNVNTLEEVAKLNLTLALRKGTTALLGSVIENVPIKSQLIETNSSYWRVKQFSNDSQGYVVTSRAAKFFMSTEGNIKNGEPILHMVPESLLSSVTGYYIRRNLPYESKMNIILMRIVESGIVRRLMQMSLEKYKKLHDIYGVLHPDAEDKKQFHVLRMNEVGVAFLVLVIGYILSIFTFVFEIIRFRMLRKVRLQVKISYG